MSLLNACSFVFFPRFLAPRGHETGCWLVRDGDGDGDVCVGRKGAERTVVILLIRCIMWLWRTVLESLPLGWCDRGLEVLSWILGTLGETEMES